MTTARWNNSKKVLFAPHVKQTRELMRSLDRDSFSSSVWAARWVPACGAPGAARMRQRVNKRIGGLSPVSLPGRTRAARLRRASETISADMLKRDQLAPLPDLPNVIYHGPRASSGTTGYEYLTWAMNTLPCPARVAQRFRASKDRAF